MDRRQLLKLGGGLGLWSAVSPIVRAAGDAAAPALDAGSKTLLDAIAETFIPTTDTVGAGGIGLADFVGLILAEWMHDDERERFVAGLAAFDRDCVATRGKPFLALPAKDKLAYVVASETAARKSMVPGQPHAPFIVWMKRLTVYGYYTSEVGASQELQLNLVPGQYDHCASIHKGDRAFSLDRHNFHFAIDNETVATE